MNREENKKRETAKDLTFFYLTNQEKFTAFLFLYS